MTTSEDGTKPCGTTHTKWVLYPNMIVPELQLRVFAESPVHEVVLIDGR